MGHQIGMKLNTSKIRAAGFIIAQQQIIKQNELIVVYLLVEQRPGQFLNAVGNDAIIGPFGGKVSTASILFICHFSTNSLRCLSPASTNLYACDERKDRLFTGKCKNGAGRGFLPSKSLSSWPRRFVEEFCLRNK